MSNKEECPEEFPWANGMILTWVGTYLILAYLNLELNPFEWGMFSRFTFVGFLVLWAYVITCIWGETREEIKKFHDKNQNNG